jgi:hypothetical protein
VDGQETLQQTRYWQVITVGPLWMHVLAASSCVSVGGGWEGLASFPGFRLLGAGDNERIDSCYILEGINCTVMA